MLLQGGGAPPRLRYYALDALGSVRVTFDAAGGGLTLSFEQKLLNSRVFYDPQTDTLTIRGVPPNLKDQLLRQS